MGVINFKDKHLELSMTRADDTDVALEIEKLLFSVKDLQTKVQEVRTKRMNQFRQYHKVRASTVSP